MNKWKTGDELRLKDWFEKFVSEVAGINWLLAAFFILVGLVLTSVAPASAKGYAIAGSVALFIAFVAYPWQKQRDRDLKVEEEKRKVIADLILHVEGHMAVLRAAGLVKVEHVPDVSDERINVQKALSVVRAYGCEAVVESTISYDKAIRNYAGKLEQKKKLRREWLADGNSISSKTPIPGYADAGNEVSQYYHAMVHARDGFFSALESALNITIDAKQIEESEDGEEVSQ